MIDALEILRTKRQGGELSREQMDAFVNGYISGKIPDFQAAALLMAIFVVGMHEDELARWAYAVLHSGQTFDFSDLDGPIADKYSTGGVGDKVSIALAPALVANGVKVPMVTSRGLAHMGGTLDKLESIPGFRTMLAPSEFEQVVRSTGMAFTGQTDELVPADRKLGSLREATGLMDSVALIAASILSTKLAEGVTALTLDVKYGSGALLQHPQLGEQLSQLMLRLSKRFSLKTTILQTSMAEPLGIAVGNGLEVREAIDCLHGAGPEDLRELVMSFGSEILCSTGLAPNHAKGRAAIAHVLDDGTAARVLEDVVEAQGGDPSCVVHPDYLPKATSIAPVLADRSGSLSFSDCRMIGLALTALGGSRSAFGGQIDPIVGITWNHKWGAHVEQGDVICKVHHRSGRGLDAAMGLLRQSFIIGEPTPIPPLVLARWDGESMAA